MAERWEGWHIANVPENPNYDEASNDRLAGQFHIVVPWSGGLDSSTALAMACEQYPGQVTALPFHAGQPWDNAEARARTFLMSEYGLNEFTEGVTVHETVGLAPAADVYGHIHVGRNLEIIRHATTVLQAQGWGEIWMGYLAGEMPVVGGDKARAAMQLTDAAHVRYPLQALAKSDLIRWWERRGGLHVARNFYSCFTGDILPCWSCQACFRTYVGWAGAGHKATVEATFDAELLQKYIDSVDSGRLKGQRARDTEIVLEPVRALFEEAKQKGRLWKP